MRSSNCPRSLTSDAENSSSLGSFASDQATPLELEFGRAGSGTAVRLDGENHALEITLSPSTSEGATETASHVSRVFW